MKKNYRRIVDEPGFQVDIHQNVPEADARLILKKLEKRFAKAKAWIGSLSMTFLLAGSRKLTFVKVEMSEDETVQISMGKPRLPPPMPKFPVAGKKLVSFIEIGRPITARELFSGKTIPRPKPLTPLLPAPKKPRKKRP